MHCVLIWPNYISTRQILHSLDRREKYTTQTDSSSKDVREPLVENFNRSRTLRKTITSALFVRPIQDTLRDLSGALRNGGSGLYLLILRTWQTFHNLNIVVTFLAAYTRRSSPAQFFPAVYSFFEPSSVNKKNSIGL